MKLTQKICEQISSSCLPIRETSNFFSFSDFIACLAVLALAWTITQTLNGRILSHSLNQRDHYLRVILFIGFVTLATDYVVATGFPMPHFEYGLGVSGLRAILAGASLLLFVNLIYIVYHKKVEPVGKHLKGYVTEVHSALSISSSDLEFSTASEKLSMDINKIVELYVDEKTKNSDVVLCKMIISRVSNREINERIFQSNILVWMEFFKACFQYDESFGRYFPHEKTKGMAFSCLKTLMKKTGESIPSSWFDLGMNLDQIKQNLEFQQSRILSDGKFMDCLSRYLIPIIVECENSGTSISDFDAMAVINLSELNILFLCANRKTEDDSWFGSVTTSIHFQYITDSSFRDIGSVSRRLSNLHFSKYCLERAQLSKEEIERAFLVINETFLNNLRQVEEMMLQGHALPEMASAAIAGLLSEEGEPHSRMKGNVSSYIIENSWVEVTFKAADVGIASFTFRYFLLFRWVDRSCLTDKAKSILSNFDVLVFFGFRGRIGETIRHSNGAFHRALGIMEISSPEPCVFVPFTIIGGGCIPLSKEKISIKTVKPWE